MESSTGTPAQGLSSAPVRFAGEPIVLGGTTYIMPALSLGDVKRLLPQIKKLTGVADAAAPVHAEAIDTEMGLGTVSAIIGAALQRNYPALGQAEIDDLIDAGMMRPLLMQVFELSGLVKRKDRSEDTAGNAVARTEATQAPSSI
jgi:hypothetical protein